MSVNTVEINRQLNRFDGHEEVWLFGYGSLIWKVDFPYIERRPARIRGWTRRFWQGSHDHRGTPESPGRVATLIEEADAVCAGMAYRISPAVFDHLDMREKNGYLREVVSMEFADGDAVEGLIYVAGPLNAAFLGETTDADIARHIARAAGPSGLNRDYFQHLADALRELGEIDPHIIAIERELARIDSAKT
ncbi:gamma-glutamylcyclotransferase [Dokdonella sp.]|uniref:gamma-glutamylcyclotransferase n=1 Tax=Dokdonella sp. TaxID=2291710 RepID=UPI003C5846B9